MQHKFVGHRPVPRVSREKNHIAILLYISHDDSVQTSPVRAAIRDLNTMSALIFRNLDRDLPN